MVTSRSDERLPLLNQKIHVEDPEQDKDMRKLIYACALTTFFFFVELGGGYITGSLAIMSDAAHLLSDLAGFAISLIAVSVSRLPANAHLSFGFARAEVLGAFVSILFIWALMVVLVIFAIHRLFFPSPVKGPLMLLLGLIGLSVNLALAFVMGHRHGHDHAHWHSHNHEHSHARRHGPVHNDRVGNGVENTSGDLVRYSSDDVFECEQDSHASHGHSRQHEATPTETSHWKSIIFGDSTDSVIVRAASLHVIGDALQNIGVILAAIIMTYKPHWSFVDPLCTLLFAMIVIMTTASTAKETLGVLMEGTPPSLSLAHVYNALRTLPGVSRVGDLHVWSITPRHPTLSVHLYETPEAVTHEVLKSAENVLNSQFGITHATIQVNCEVVECCDAEITLRDGSGKNCVTSDVL